ncbi:PREDICTED: mediator of RNA polymerase II transcription subunit 14-like isoform X2 [Rhagoletis zephyria]|nr:PREDICTED: mediator of RNA polymerase II transcription subunit 14-like isoform X2 [Rhagoletis zephyria]XP_036335373.1 mediator of RNA polymerase II transcription subunit 14-like [Rhagoletis pomonella]XP_036335374.1 mediator of RNA polymerase II transcription subunit 14-like [Rhagoletis pomonella]
MSFLDNQNMLSLETADRLARMSHETGDGKALVHQLQVNYIHQLIQARLVENPKALSEVYNCFHHFCQSLQLKVLYTQTLRLSYERLDENINIEEYVPGVKTITQTALASTPIKANYRKL